MRASTSVATRFAQLLRRRRWVMVIVPLAGAPIAGLYVYQSFLYPNPSVRILLRTLPILPLAIWTLWFDTARPFQDANPLLRRVSRVMALVVVMALAVMLLGLALNWLYDPSRVL